MGTRVKTEQEIYNELHLLTCERCGDQYWGRAIASFPCKCGGRYLNSGALRMRDSSRKWQKEWQGFDLGKKNDEAFKKISDQVKLNEFNEFHRRLKLNERLAGDGESVQDKDNWEHDFIHLPGLGGF